MIIYSESIPQRLISQYQNSTLLIAFFEALASEADILQEQFTAVLTGRWLSNAVGVQLDIIGNLVGVSREVVDFQTGIFFGFFEDVTALGYDSLSQVVLDAGRYRGSDESTADSRLLGDDEYRVLIQAKILANTSDITPNAVMVITAATLKVIFPNDSIPVTITETGNASFTINIEAEIDAATQAFFSFLDLVPRPAGVRITYNYTTPPNTLLSEDGLALFYQDGTEQEIQT